MTTKQQDAADAQWAEVERTTPHERPAGLGQPQAKSLTTKDAILSIFDEMGAAPPTEEEMRAAKAHARGLRVVDDE